MLRLIPTATHSTQDVEYTVQAFKAIKDKLLSGEYVTEHLADIHKNTIYSN